MVVDTAGGIGHWKQQDLAMPSKQLLQTHLPKAPDMDSSSSLKPEPNHNLCSTRMLLLLKELVLTVRTLILCLERESEGFLTRNLLWLGIGVIR